MELVSGLIGVILGAALAYEIQRRIRREDTALKARLVLVEGLPLLWTAHFQGLKTHLHRLRAYLEDAAVGGDLIERVEAKAWECWRNGQQEGHYDPEEGTIIESALIEEYEAIVDEIHESLRRRGWFS